MANAGDGWLSQQCASLLRQPPQKIYKIIKNFFAEIILADLVPDPNPDSNPEPDPNIDPDP